MEIASTYLNNIAGVSDGFLNPPIQNESISDKKLASGTIHVELAIRNKVDIERATAEQERITHFRVVCDKNFR